jgi:GNAT superfamily N-acetyltransferase
MRGRISGQARRKPLSDFSGEAVIGYYTLAVGCGMREEAPERLAKALARHPVPIMLRARLAVDQRWQGQGVGKALWKDAMLARCKRPISPAFAAHAKDEEARRFYLEFDFIPSPSDPMPLFVLLKDVRRIVTGQ